MFHGVIWVYPWHTKINESSVHILSPRVFSTILIFLQHFHSTLSCQPKRNRTSTTTMLRYPRRHGWGSYPVIFLMYMFSRNTPNANMNTLKVHSRVSWLSNPCPLLAGLCCVFWCHFFPRTLFWVPLGFVLLCWGKILIRACQKKNGSCLAWLFYISCPSQKPSKPNRMKEKRTLIQPENTLGWDLPAQAKANKPEMESEI